LTFPILFFYSRQNILEVKMLLSQRREISRHFDPIRWSEALKL
jgi:hypothetical protein